MRGQQAGGDATQVEKLFRGVLEGEPGAWERLHDRFAGLVWSVVRAFGLAEQDAADAYQTTWLRLVEHLDGIRNPERLGAWLATTARRSCLRILRQSGREIASGEDDLEPASLAREPEPVEARLLAAERDAIVWTALASLAERCQRLLRLLLAEPPPSYAEVSAALGMRIGSIGPTRRRCLAELEQRLAQLGIDMDGPGS